MGKCHCIQKRLEVFTIKLAEMLIRDVAFLNMHQAVYTTENEYFLVPVKNLEKMILAYAAKEIGIDYANVSGSQQLS